MHHPTITERLAAIRSEIEGAATHAQRSADAVTLLAVSKRQPDAKVEQLLAAGHRAFGENLVQPWAERSARYPQAQWHIIGPLQSKKASVVWRSRPALIHTIDREKLVEAFERRQELEPAQPLDGLIQVNIDAEPQKAGVTPDALDALCDRITASPALNLRGLMAIPRPLPDGTPPNDAFERLRKLGERIADRLPARYELSMGMSGDFPVAIAHGATIVRVGTALFGPREA